ncbi:MAG: Na(+)-translocating NADH-quinone reductase subunit C, partial [Pseudomonadales bacterium]
MASDKDSIKNIIVVALSVCFVCAIIVSGAAVSLRPMQAANKEADRYKNILIAAGLYKDGQT